MKGLEVTFDIDGVMHNLALTACKRANVDYGKIDTYVIDECEQFTEEERNKIYTEYGSVECFKESWKSIRPEEASLFNMLVDNGIIVPTINSCSFSSDIAEYKREVIKKAGLHISDENVKLQIIGVNGGKRVEPCDIIVEDYYNNIVKARKVSEEAGRKMIGILIMRPYNKKYRTLELLSDGILVAMDFRQALETIAKISVNMSY